MHRSQQPREEVITWLTSEAEWILAGPNTLTRAILIACIAHGEQRDHGGSSYIRHPLRVMEGCDSEDEMIVAVLHDTVEDSPITLQNLKDLSFTASQVQSIDCLTHREGEAYPDSIQRAKSDYVARKVKLRDIKDNSQLWRLKSKKLRDRDFVRMQNYIDALDVLGGLEKP